MTSPESTEAGDPPNEVWLSGHEIIRFTDDLLGLDDEREEPGAGYTTRLAVKTVQLALKVPGTKVLVKDHINTTEAHRQLLQLCMGLLEYLRVDYDVGTERKLKDFDQAIWIRVRPLYNKVIPNI